MTTLNLLSSQMKVLSRHSHVFKGIMPSKQSARPKDRPGWLTYPLSLRKQMVLRTSVFQPMSSLSTRLPIPNRCCSSVFIEVAKELRGIVFSKTHTASCLPGLLAHSRQITQTSQTIHLGDGVCSRTQADSSPRISQSCVPLRHSNLWFTGTTSQRLLFNPLMRVGPNWNQWSINSHNVICVIYFNGLQALSGNMVPLGRLHIHPLQWQLK